MEYATSPQRIYRKISSREKNSSAPSLVLHINDSDIISTFANDCTYRTEAYLQEREKPNVVTPPTSSSTTTTWRNLKYQKQILDHDQAEIDRALSTIDSIHKIFNRSLLIPHNRVYSSLYGNDNKSDRLMKTFCQCQNHCTNVQDSAADTYTQETLNSKSILNFNDTNSDLDDIEDKKKNSYDSGYGSVMPRRRISRESFAQISNHLNSTMNSIK
ncbi:unnamed protein product [Rotaria magnacalcarata]|uniref:Uncharacterized protein n=1 Tax=Rotaria magnacalcarata TaxID=392030 RepID=A0A816PER0_9BILA|nr:unnamed protein product [Rotaria magnacalcarata]CAF1493701.1 unnamed protein product [Rotaria magnacalcarata]CAF2047698.1 unnamed protein product [Rotaria magnacalcarata]CAF5069683.1 unnamed protein product [Rotaria magnacalcarata]CAF5178438.1 unnamed protein product [Rotaria magnacalcarata]